MAATLPLLRGFEANDVLGCHRGRAVSAARFCHAAQALAARVPRSRFAFNLCEGQIAFMLASVAALAAGQTLILPQARLPSVLATLRRAYADSYSLVDTTTRGDIAQGSEQVMVALDESDDGVWPPPSIPADHQAAILFTSGSTREPEPQRKAWRDLVGGADTLLRSLGAPPRGTAIVGTVPPQHMFGLETTVMLPLQSGTPVVDVRPAYPADLPDAFAAAQIVGADDIWLMTTPLQLRAFLRELGAVEVNGLRRIVASTMPVDESLAQAVERDWQAPLYEIYGCTEGGILATRRPARERRFTPAAGLTFTSDEAGTASVAGGHLPSPLPLGDRIRIYPSTNHSTFELLGRSEDVVKIAGKRASLEGLTRQLRDIDGVRDGIVFLPDPASSRVAAAVVAPALAASDVRSALAQRIDAAFMPRPLVLVDALPRAANGKLPLSALRALIAAREDDPTNGSGRIVLESTGHVPADHAALAGHFPGEPIVPGVVLLQMIETMLTGAGWRVRECSEAKFRAPVSPATDVVLRVEIDGAHKAKFVAETARGIAMTGTFICTTPAATS